MIKFQFKDIFYFCKQLIKNPTVNLFLRQTWVDNHQTWILINVFKDQYQFHKIDGLQYYISTEG